MKSWNDVFIEHAESVLNAALRITGNLADAEDVSQEVFAEAYRKSTLHPHEKLGGLLRRIAVCRAIDFLRSKKSFDALPPQLCDRQSNSPLDTAATREIETRLRTVISELPTRETEVFCLIFFERLSHSDVSQILEISKGAVAKSLSTARARINERFTVVLRRDQCQ